LRLPRRFVLPSAALVGVLALGTAGYVLIEGMSAVDAFYLTAVTVSTVGYGDVVPVTRAGTLFTVALIMTGVGTVLYLRTQLGELVIEGQLREVFGRFAMQREIEKLRGHVIVCGYRRFGGARRDPRGTRRREGRAHGGRAGDGEPAVADRRPHARRGADARDACGVHPGGRGRLPGRDRRAGQPRAARGARRIRLSSC
jgi:hypothetical protein